MGQIKSYCSPSGRTAYYDESGRQIGTSYENSHGHITYYDSDGRKIGDSYRNRHSGKITHYDAGGRLIGYSRECSGGMNHFDADWNPTGKSIPHFFEGYVTQGDPFFGRDGE